MLLLENGAIPTEELRELVIQKQQASYYERESYVQILELFDEYFKQQEFKAALNTQGSTSSNMLSSTPLTEVPNGAIVNLIAEVAAIFMEHLSKSQSTETGKRI